MKEFKAKFEKNGNDDFDVVDIFEVNGKPFKKIPNFFPLPPNIKKIRTVEIHMIQLISAESCNAVTTIRKNSKREFF